MRHLFRMYPPHAINCPIYISVKYTKDRESQMPSADGVEAEHDSDSDFYNTAQGFVILSTRHAKHGTGTGTVPDSAEDAKEAIRKASAQIDCLKDVQGKAEVAVTHTAAPVIANTYAFVGNNYVAYDPKGKRPATDDGPSNVKKRNISFPSASGGLPNQAAKGRNTVKADMGKQEAKAYTEERGKSNDPARLLENCGNKMERNLPMDSGACL
ncbi:hypothetical protein KC19_VG182800 [Ceratodon purpureus]|uniref:Uncharacterized protein n=1 Tax=Ceratodon purpureus TaxID=3225 RepID=A0A8T0HRL6_CERPU|nr:hypothetical protein KC19_VG182800 [Ceratodon purpureus]